MRTAGGLAHQLLTRDGTPERDVRLWEPDDDDVEAISGPLAGLASRRLPEGAENPDIADAIALVLGLAVYALKQRAKQAEIVRFYTPTGPDERQDDDQPENVPPAAVGVDPWGPATGPAPAYGE